jgi:hypothetical protein
MSKNKPKSQCVAFSIIQNSNGDSGIIINSVTDTHMTIDSHSLWVVGHIFKHDNDDDFVLVHHEDDMELHFNFMIVSWDRVKSQFFNVYPDMIRCVSKIIVNSTSDFKMDIKQIITDPGKIQVVVPNK